MKKWVINDPQIRSNAANAVMAIRGEDNLEVIIQEHKESKSGEQRGFWHVLIKIISDDTGYRPDEVKEMLKKRILGTREIKIGGFQTEVTVSSESRDKVGYSELIEHTYQLAAEAGIVLPSSRYNG